MKLYEIDAAFFDLLRLIEEADGELTPEVDAELDRLNGELVDKAESVAALVKQWEAYSTICDDQIKRMQARKKSWKGAADHLRRYLHGAMDTAQKRKLKTSAFTISISTRKATVIDCEAEELPAEYRRTKVEADKKAIGEALKAGQALPFAHLEESSSLTIR